MPDISMCQDSTCPMRGDCYRYRAKPNPYRQSYFMGVLRQSDTQCDYQYRIDGEGNHLRTTVQADADNTRKLKGLS